MKTELTCDDMSMLQDALAYKLLYLKERELATGIYKGVHARNYATGSKAGSLEEGRI